MILGIDEVGRGAWAGPLVVGAVILNDLKIEGLTDSKKLTPKQRIYISEEIKNKAKDYSLGWVHADELDNLGMSKALEIAALRAIDQIRENYNEVVIDGNHNFLSRWKNSNIVTTIKKADQLIPSVSAASVLAKVARDEFMKKQHLLYPEYGFKSNVGYGTRFHQTGIKKSGSSTIHRNSFLPVINKGFTSKEIGNEAENVSCKYLKSIGHKIIERNWKTKVCEIDIISKHENTIYFTEVKYRKNGIAGDGLESITNRKLKQMIFAAENYMNNIKVNKSNYILAAASVSSNPMQLDSWVEIL